MILPKERDPRLVTVRRGGTLTDDDHRRHALWAVACAAHVLPLFEAVAPHDDRPRRALETAHAWVRGEVPMREAHRMAFVANAAARDLTGAAKFAALAAGQAVAVAHVAAHNLGAAAYAIRAAGAAADPSAAETAMRAERAWQRAQLPPDIRALVLEDQHARNALCWGVFEG